LRERGKTPRKKTIEIKAGHIVQGPRWPEPVEVNLVEDSGNYIHLVGATTGSGEHVDQLIPRDELARLQIARVETDFTAPSREVFQTLPRFCGQEVKLHAAAADDGRSAHRLPG